MRAILLLMLLSFFIQGCSTLMFWRSDDAAEEEEEEQEGEENEAKGSLIDLSILEGGRKYEEQTKRSIEDLELKNARLWRRVDELDEQVTGMREKLKVIEKGLVLGLVPEELMESPKEQPTKKSPKIAIDHSESDDEIVVEAGAEKVAMPPEPAFDQNLYNQKMAAAQELYQQGKFGRAIVEYSSIGREFGDVATDGVHLYWIGRSWGALKEFQTSRQYFIDFIKAYPTSKMVPRAKLDLARVELALGLRETALQRFRRIIQEHPYEDAAEMAKMELKSLERNL